MTLSEIHKKVNELENKIFEEIEQKDQEEIVKDDPENNNVTLRRGKGRKMSTSSAGSLSKKARVSSEPEENADKNLDDTRANTSKRITRTPKKAATEPETSESQVKPMQTRNSKSKNISLTINEDEPRYMISLKNRKRNTITNLDRNKREKQNGRSFADVPTSLDNTLLKSDSMQGYQDSDASPVVNHKRKKRSLKYSTHNLKKQHRNKQFKRNIEYITSDSSNCSFSGPIKNAIENSSVYKSDSYKILMTKKHPFSVMEIIDEDNATSKSLADIKYFNAISSSLLNIHDRNTMSSPASGVAMHANSDSSSMASLPMSPVLSVIENISIRKDSFNVLDQSHNKSKVNDKSEYVSDKDLPPMCEISDLIAKRLAVNKDTESRMSIDNRRSTISDSFLEKVKRVEIRERSVSDTIDKGIKDLLLDSARKKPKNTEKDHMELDVPESDSKKSKVKKRSSTPRKKKNLNAKFNQIAEVIQEHVETYSSGGRKSCPPSVCVYDCDDNVISNDNTLSVPENNKRGKKKKDIIKVKILKPKRKSKSKQMSLIETDLLYKDSGINNTELELLHTIDDSVEFIHNHSDTCIHGNECMGEDSVEFVGSSESIITLSNESTQSCHAWFGKQSENVPQDILHNTNNASAFIDDSGVLANINTTSNNLFDSPISGEASYNSLITDDLSDEIVTPPNSVTKPSNWYLFSEDDSTNFINQDINNGSVGSNLNKLFPIACAVPNLSTITELSRENGECSRKSSDEKGTDGL
ncbi:hypothetical protein K1T71_010194 [Dendrolimus kikuchii]|uniref:Uncharacterized protein n=1 Tax=Dendrolimus kikuchii TaxID=765133 RepID=A0ACC1CQV1_9NEOP|nr:hypothetical protein K1T71_010194 [Dendrolimus kikuchii]